jgi:hypothetical protein
LIYKKYNFFKKINNKYDLVFVLICLVLLLFFIFTCLPAVTRTVVYYPLDEIKKTNEKNLNISLEQVHLVPEIGDFIFIDVVAENIGNVKYPSSGIIVTWDHTGDKTNDDATLTEIRQQTCRIVIDGIKHSCYIPIGENSAWAQISEPGSNTGNDSLDNNSNSGNNNIGNDTVSDNTISSISIESPEIEGIKIKISGVRLTRRLILPLDSYINYQAKKLLNIDQINRFTTPSYIFLIFSLVLFVVYVLLCRIKRISISRKNKTFENTFTDISGTEYVNKEQKMPSVKILIFISTAILLAFSFYFIVLNSFTIKSYIDSYKQYILKGELDKTYEGFYNFRRFVSWIDQEVPDGENIIVLLRGEPVYIMSEMAYGLYPKDVKYINVSKKNDQRILSEIKEINRTGKNNNQSYRYIVIISKEDIFQSADLELIYKYRENGGFLYKLR